MSQEGQTILISSRALLGIVVAVSLALGACADDPSEGASTASTATGETGSTEPSPSESTAAAQEEGATMQGPSESASLAGGSVQRAHLGEYPPELSGIVGGMVSDLATTLDIDENDVIVAAVEEVIWTDASLGCPEPGMVYTQVVTDGMRVVLQAGDALYDYRSGGSGDTFRCASAESPDKSTAGSYELTEDGVVQVSPPVTDETLPTEGNDPPDV